MKTNRCHDKRKSSSVGADLVLVLVLAAAGLTACATYEWQKPGASTAEVSQTLWQCSRQAELEHPPMNLMQPVSRFVTTTEEVCSASNGSGQGSCRTVTRTTQQFVWEFVDANERTRDKFVEQCMQSQGYEWVKVEK